MKHFLVITILVFNSTYLLADFEKGTIYKTNGDVIACSIQVYEPGTLVGNVEVIQCRTENEKFEIPLEQISRILISDRSYHILTLNENSTDLFDEAATVSYLVLAQLVEKGTVSLYHYSYSGNSIYENGKAYKCFGKPLHRKPILTNGTEAVVVHKMNYSSKIKSYFPDHGDKILAQGLAYDEIASAVIEGNKHTSTGFQNN